MKQQLNLTMALLFIATGGVIWEAAGTSRAQAQAAANGSGSSHQERTADQVYANIQVFKGLPESQLLPAMQFMAASLGVSCQHCHTNQFAQDDIPAKQTARRMIAMMRAINQGNFSNNLSVNCYTCHRGQLKPALVVPVASNQPAPVESSGTKAVETMPTPDQVLDRYLMALGGKAKLDNVTTQSMKGSVVESSGTNPPTSMSLEIYRKAPNRMLVVRQAGKNTFVQAFNGTIAWRQFGGRAGEMGGMDTAFARREAKFDKDVNLKDQFTRMTVIGKEKIGAREAYLIEAVPIDGHIGNLSYLIERMSFDIQTGLLLRRLLEVDTVLGIVSIATDFEDYREVDGVKLPFTTRLALPSSSTTFRLTEIKLNTQIDDERFNMPGR